MLSDIIIIIPTHKRQHYLNRVAWYYSHFDMQVYICDSTPGQPGVIIEYPNIHYIWCPEKNFYTKILDVLETTDAAYCATSPDDDFLKYETLMECYEAMKGDCTYSMGVGMQCFFKEGFENKAFISDLYLNGLQGLNLHGCKLFNTIKFWSNYQNVLWTLFRRDMIRDAFETLIRQQYNSQNFIELTLGMKAIEYGNIYVSSNYLNFRELTEGEHWGKEEAVISVPNYFKNQKMKDDISAFWNLPYNKINHRVGLICYLFMTSNKYGMAFKRISRSIFQGAKVKKIFFDSISKQIEQALSYV